MHRSPLLPRRRASSIEVLESRIAPAVVATYSGPANDRQLTLTISTVTRNLVQTDLSSISDPDTLSVTSSDGVYQRYDFSYVGVTSLRIIGSDEGDLVSISPGVLSPDRSFYFDGGGGAGLFNHLNFLERDGGSITATPRDTNAGSFESTVYGSGSYVNATRVGYSGFDLINIVTPPGASTVDISSDDFVYAGGSTISFNSNSSDVHIDLGQGDDASGSDHLTFHGTPFNIKSFSVSVGNGDDVVEFQDLYNIYPFTSLPVDGGAGSDTISFTTDANAVLTDGSFTSNKFAQGTSIGLTSFEVANLTGGESANTFSITNWSGAGSLDGGGGSDTVISANDTDFSLSNAALARGGRGTFSLTSIEAASLTGGVSANTFSLSGFTGSATLVGGGGADVLNVSESRSSDTKIELTDSQLTYTGSGPVTYSAIATVNLTGGSGADGFSVTKYTGAGTIDGGGGANVILANNDVSTYSVNATQLARGGLPTLNLSHIDSATLGGGVVAKTFEVSGLKGTINLTGSAANDLFQVLGGSRVSIGAGAGADTINVTSDGVLSLAGGAGDDVFTLTGAATGSVNGEADNDSFTISDLTGDVTLLGGAGQNTVSAMGDSDWSLTSSSLVRQTGAAGQTLTLSNISSVSLTGGSSANLFKILGYTGALFVDGGGGSDKLAVTSDAASFVLTPAQLIRTGAAALSYLSFEEVDLLGEDGDNTFDVSGYAGTGSVTGGGGTDSLVATNAGGSNLDFTLSDTALTRTGFGALSLDGLEVAKLTGGTEFNHFEISDFTGAGTIDGGAGGEDLVSATSDVPLFVLSDSKLSRTGRGDVTLVGVSFVDLVGGAGANTITLDSYSGNGSFSGGDGADTLVVLGTAAISLDDTILRSSAGLVAQYDNFEAVQVPGAPLTYLSRGEQAALAVNLTGVSSGHLVETYDPADGTNLDVIRTIDFGMGLTVSNAPSLLVNTGDTPHNLALAGGQTGFADVMNLGDLGAAPQRAVSFSNIRQVTIETGNAADHITLQTLAATGLEGLTIHTGGGDDTLELATLPTTAFGPVDLGTGYDTFRVTVDASMSLTASSLLLQVETPDLGPGLSIDLPSSLENAVLTGGESANRFVVQGWSRPLTISGLGGNDVFDLTGGATGPGVTLVGGTGDDTFLLQAGREASLSGLTAPALITGGEGMDSITASGDLNFHLSDTLLVRTAPALKKTPATSVTTYLSDLEHAVLTGGDKANLLDAGLFSGTSDLAGGGGVDNLISARAGGQLYGFHREAATTAEMKNAKQYTRDNFFAPDGTVAGSLELMATTKAGNVLSFRYYEGLHQAGITFTLPEAGQAGAQVVSAAEHPALAISMLTGSGLLSMVEGSSFVDKLTGNKTANTLAGLGGDDMLVAVGKDKLIGGAGKDKFQGPAMSKVQNGSFVLPGVVGIRAPYTPPAPQSMDLFWEIAKITNFPYFAA